MDATGTFQITAVYITLLASIITAFASIIAPVLTAIINNRSAYRLQSTELFFKAKSEAYKSFLSYAANFPPSPSPDEMQKLQEYHSQAMLFSSTHTQSCISEYAQCLLRPEHTKSWVEKVSRLYKKAVLAMQDDLMKQPKKPRIN